MSHTAYGITINSLTICAIPENPHWDHVKHKIVRF